SLPSASASAGLPSRWASTVLPPDLQMPPAPCTPAGSPAHAAAAPPPLLPPPSLPPSPGRDRRPPTACGCPAPGQSPPLLQSLHAPSAGLQSPPALYGSHAPSPACPGVPDTESSRLPASAPDLRSYTSWRPVQTDWPQTSARSAPDASGTRAPALLRLCAALPAPRSAADDCVNREYISGCSPPA